MSTVRETSSLAITSLVAGILGWTIVPLLGSLVAIVTGHLARSEIRRQPERLQGDGLAVTGLVLGYVMVLGSIAAIVMLFAFFGGLVWLGVQS